MFSNVYMSDFLKISNGFRNKCKTYPAKKEISENTGSMCDGGIKDNWQVKSSVTKK